ncbi:hypothetical protein HG530_005165 [Fusarium avenaceum]|nr:hypothetical protein HG530_005165 [Fusarium avenaceum]
MDKVLDAAIEPVRPNGRGGDVTTTTSPVDVNVLAFGVLVAGVLGLDAEGVGTEVVTLSLEEVGGEVLGAVTVEPRQSGGEGGSRDTKEGSLGNDVSPAGLSLVDGLVEEVVEEKVLELRLLTVGVGNVLEEDGSDDAATSPHEGDGRLVELPVELASGLLHEHEALGVGDDLGSVKSLLEVLEELLLVTLELGGSADELQLGRGGGTLVLDGGQASGKDGLSNEGYGLAEVKSVDSGPLSGTLLASLVENLLNEGSAIVVVEVHDITGDLNQERVQNALVPLSQDVTDLLAGEAKTTLHDVVSLSVIGTLVANPLTASLAVALGGDALEDVLDVRPGLLVTTRHERGAVSGTLLTTGDTGADEADVLASKILGAAVGVGEVRVTTVDDDVAGVKERQDLLNPVVDSLTSLDQEHDTTGRLELADELLDAVGADNGLALGLVLEESVDLGDGSVESADGEAVVSHVQNKVLSPVKRMSMSCEADEAQIRTCHIVSIRRIWSRSRSRGSVLLRGAQIEVSETSSTSRA